MIHINKFLDKIKVAKARHDANYIMSIHEANDLHADITKLLLALHELSQSQNTTSSPDEITKIEIKGSDF